MDIILREIIKNKYKKFTKEDLKIKLEYYNTKLTYMLKQYTIKDIDQHTDILENINAIEYILKQRYDNGIICKINDKKVVR